VVMLLQAWSKSTARGFGVWNGVCDLVTTTGVRAACLRELQITAKSCRMSGRVGDVWCCKVSWKGECDVIHG
jgi:hypothetical protein